MEDTPSSNTGSTPGRSATDELKGKAQEVGKQAKSKAQGAAQRIKEEGKQRLESGKESAAEKAEQLADAVDRASDELHQQQEHGLADYASQVATGINTFADSLRNRSIDDLIEQTQSFARRNPTLFFASSLGVGFALSRFLKASARHAEASAGRDERGFDVSYDANAEWQAPEASQSIYGSQPNANARASAASADDDAGITPTDFDTPNATNIPPGGAYP